MTFLIRFQSDLIVVLLVVRYVNRELIGFSFEYYPFDFLNINFEVIRYINIPYFLCVYDILFYF